MTPIATADLVIAMVVIFLIYWGATVLLEKAGVGPVTSHVVRGALVFALVFWVLSNGGVVPQPMRCPGCVFPLW